MLIAVAGPYSAGSSEEQRRNLETLNRAAAEVLRLGHVPIIGVNAALPVVDFLGDNEDRYEAIMKISLAVVDKCDAILMIGESAGAKRERELIRAKGLPVYTSIAEIPISYDRAD
jgi:hypothetical protein